MWGKNNNHLIVEITDPDHYQNLINCSLARGWSLQQMSWKFVQEFLWHPADIQNRGDNTASLAEVKIYPLIYISIWGTAAQMRPLCLNYILEGSCLYIFSFGGSVCMCETSKASKNMISNCTIRKIFQILFKLPHPTLKKLKFLSFEKKYVTSAILQGKKPSWR